jgi:hypothetical protein
MITDEEINYVRETCLERVRKINRVGMLQNRMNRLYCIMQETQEEIDTILSDKPLLSMLNGASENKQSMELPK